MTRSRARVGTSGWTYRHWRGPYYPEKLPAREWLSWYARDFDTVEVNNTFYKLPTKRAVDGWLDAVPKRFSFALKAHHRITHRKRLRDPAETLPPFLDSLAPFGKRLGVVLFQLPPKWRADPERLERFLDELPDAHRYALEARDASWWTHDVFEVLARHGVAFVWHDFGERPTPRVETARFLYVRFHGPDAPYRGRYGARRLAPWTRRLQEAGKPAFVYFNNDEAAHAVDDAQWLRAKLRGEPPPRRRKTPAPSASRRANWPLA